MDPLKKRRALRSFTNGVYILTSKSGDRYGAGTVTWVSQASFKPPLVMAAVRKESNAFQCLSQSHVAAIHVLRSGQENLAQSFFTPTVAAEGKINGEPFTDKVTAAPVLTSVPAYVECRVRQIIEGQGDHAIVIMEVVEAEFREQFRPLTIRESPWEYGG
jgi:flavin reductase (DIM6/NTAB) family NADH-FMN oxidoreductase RutF